MDSVIVFCAQYLFVIVPLLWIYTWFEQTSLNKKKLVLGSLVAAVIAVILARISAGLYYDPRPFTHGGVKALFAHGPDNGFPSDHAWFTATVSTILYFYNRQIAYAAAGLAVIVGVARVAAHVHSPIDIVGGFAIGALAAYLGNWLAKKIRP